MRYFVSVTNLDAETLADAFVQHVYCLHGTPDNIISDRRSQFVSEFWQYLSDHLGITLKHSSAFHPQTDGQTEWVNAGAE
jgi:transposase InsO family protein